jgi:hypothetical protein
MKYNSLLGIAVCLTLISVVACSKDDKPKDVFEKKGLVMNAAQEPNGNTSTATGTIDVTYNKTTKVMNFSLAFANLTGNAVAAHIHGTAARGLNAGVKHPLDPFPSATSGTFAGSVTVDNTTIKEDSLLAGFYYFNIHTPTNPGGEIRGQIEF